MGTPDLEVTVDGLYALSKRCDVLAGELAVAPPSAAADSGWQTGPKAVNAAHARVGKAMAAVAARMRVAGTHLAEAGTRFAASDGETATASADGTGGGSVLV
jgi:hypothetical protein